MVLLTPQSQEYEYESESEASSSSSTYNYDVFLSFRGEDTRNSFTDHLHAALLNANIQTFLDDAEIQTGEDLKPELVGAIKSSRASIIVLSKGYASSTWCLDELVLILQQRKNFNQIVIPVFYHVEPAHVRKQQSSFGDAMAKHKQRMDAETNADKKNEMAWKIEKWKEALMVVSDIKGEEANGRRETILINEIVKEISRRLHLPKRAKIPKIIGMESSKKTTTSFLKDKSSESAEILTIWGMAGIGKTYLAEYVFRCHYHEFERRCFLQDIERKCASSNGLLDLQKQLLKDLHYGSWMDIENTNAATFKIGESLLTKRTLLVLDDVSMVEHLDMFIGTKGLHPGSKIIITCKNESLTETWLFQTQAPLKHTKEALEGLSKNESIELLSWYAFGRIDPEVSEKEEPKKVVDYCQGHPLALKVLGSSLRNKDTTWKDILKSLRKGINSDIKKVLQVSIDSLLCEEDKDMFKYIACFFVWEDRYLTEEILEVCGIGNSSTISKLTNRCLLTIKGNYVYMHRLLQDIGRDMVYQESPKKPWKRSLLWNHEECFDVLQNGKGTSNIQGLILDMRKFKDGTSCGSVLWWLLGWVYGSCSTFQTKESGLQTHAFRNMCNLRILRLNYVQLNGSYKNFPKGLRWLCMHGFPLSYIPSDLTMEKMVALDLTNSSLKQLWMKPKLLKSLKFLNLSCCRELVRVGSFCGLPSLERLILAECTSLVEVCESIGNYCDRLEVLDLSECNKLKKLPRSLGKLKKLTELSLNGCSMELLQVVDANNININNTEAIARSYKSFVISLPSSLVHLSLQNNNLSNASFPKNIHGLSMLKWLYLGGNPIDSLPEFVRSLSRLERLGLDGCSRLTTISCVPSTLKHLYTKSCDLLQSISFSPQTSTPPCVHSYGSKSLSEIQGMLKVNGISEIKEEILHSLGWINIKDAKDFKHTLTYTHNSTYLSSYIRETHKIEMIYGNGVFNTYFKGEELPYWITHRNKGKGSSISISIPSSPNGYRIRGLNVCFLMRLIDMDNCIPWVVIRNSTKNCFWEYGPRVCIKSETSEEGSIIWLSNWIFRNNEFEDGDEVSFNHDGVYDEFQDDDVGYHFDGCYDHVREFGISFVYDEINKKEDPLASYKSWQRIACQDLSTSHPTYTFYPVLENW